MGKTNLQQNVLFWLALEKIVESNFAQLLDGEVLGQADPAGKEGEGVAVERLGVEPDGVGDGQDPALDVFHVFSQSENLVFPTFALPGGTEVVKSVNLIRKKKIIMKPHNWMKVLEEIFPRGKTIEAKITVSYFS